MGTHIDFKVVYTPLCMEYNDFSKKNHTKMSNGPFLMNYRKNGQKFFKRPYLGTVFRKFYVHEKRFTGHSFWATALKFHTNTPDIWGHKVTCQNFDIWPQKFFRALLLRKKGIFWARPTPTFPKMRFWKPEGNSKFWQVTLLPHMSGVFLWNFTTVAQKLWPVKHLA